MAGIFVNINTAVRKGLGNLFMPRDRVVGLFLIAITVLTALGTFSTFNLNYTNKTFINDITCNINQVNNVHNPPDCKYNQKLIVAFSITAMAMALAIMLPWAMTFLKSLGDLKDYYQKDHIKWWNYAHPLFGWTIFGFLLATMGLWARTYKYFAIKHVENGANALFSFTSTGYTGDSLWFAATIVAGFCVVTYQTYAANHSTVGGVYNLGMYYTCLVVAMCLSVAALSTDTFAHYMGTTGGIYESFCIPGDNLNCHGVVTAIKILLIIGTILAGLNGVCFSYLIVGKIKISLFIFPLVESIFWSLFGAMGCAWSAFSLWAFIYTRVQFGVTNIWSVSSLWSCNGTFFLLFNAVTLTMAWIYFCIHETYYIDADGNMPGTLWQNTKKVVSDLPKLVGRFFNGGLKPRMNKDINNEIFADDTTNATMNWKMTMQKIMQMSQTKKMYLLFDFASVFFAVFIIAMGDMFMHGDVNGVNKGRGLMTSISCADPTSTFDCTGYFIGIQALIPITGVLFLIAIIKYIKGKLHRNHSVFWLTIFGAGTSTAAFFLWLVVIKQNDIKDGEWNTATEDTFMSTGGWSILTLMLTSILSVFSLISAEQLNKDAMVLPDKLYTKKK
jgi:hypothetical protein